MLWSFSTKIMLNDIHDIHEIHEVSEDFKRKSAASAKKVQLGQNMRPNPQKYGSQHITTFTKAISVP